jgi:hypothetical protein
MIKEGGVLYWKKHIAERNIIRAEAPHLID